MRGVAVPFYSCALGLLLHSGFGLPFEIQSESLTVGQQHHRPASNNKSRRDRRRQQSRDNNAACGEVYEETEEEKLGSEARSSQQ